MLVSVTQNDIDSGSRTCSDCPIALAIIRKPGVYYVEVDANGVELWTSPDDWVDDANSLICALPDEALRFMNRFDSGAEVQPFEFRINVPRFDD